MTETKRKGGRKPKERIFETYTIIQQSDKNGRPKNLYMDKKTSKKFRELLGKELESMSSKKGLSKGLKEYNEKKKKAYEKDYDATSQKLKEWKGKKIPKEIKFSFLDAIISKPERVKSQKEIKKEERMKKMKGYKVIKSKKSEPELSLDDPIETISEILTIPEKPPEIIKNIVEAKPEEKQRKSRKQRKKVESINPGQKTLNNLNLIRQSLELDVEDTDKINLYISKLEENMRKPAGILKISRMANNISLLRKDFKKN